MLVEAENVRHTELAQYSSANGTHCALRMILTPPVIYTIMHR